MMCADNNLCCVISKCSIYGRNNWSREGEKDSMFGVDVLDNIHCYLCHSVDVGYTIIHGMKTNDDDDANLKWGWQCLLGWIIYPQK